MTEHITSLQNPKIKLLTALQQKSSERRRTGLFVVEGQQELQHCIRAGYEVDTVFWCPELCPAVLPPEAGAARCFQVSPDVYAKVAIRWQPNPQLLTFSPSHLTMSASMDEIDRLAPFISHVAEHGNDPKVTSVRQMFPEGFQCEV